jgi:hypothetical protein
MGWWNAIWKTRAKEWIYQRLEPSQVAGAASSNAVSAENAYLTIRLASMRIVDVRKGVSTFYGAVHSHISLPHVGGERATFDVVTTPSALQAVDAKHLDRVISVNKTLLGPVPYRGGSVEMEVGLFSVKQANLVGPYLALLESLSSAAGVSFVKAALPFAQPLQQGVALLTGSDDKDILEIGIDSTIEPPVTGYYLVMRAKKGSVNVGQLKVNRDDMRLVDSAGESIGNYPYILIEIAASPKRETWYELPDLQSAYAALKQAVRAGKVSEATEQFAVFKRTALTSEDLLFADAKQIVDGVDQWLKAVLGSPVMTGMKSDSEQPDLPELRQLNIYESEE